ncbi:hypothetical protein DMENIID0001_157950 [Sergentomyia squamirostris]
MYCRPCSEEKIERTLYLSEEGQAFTCVCGKHDTLEVNLPILYSSHHCDDFSPLSPTPLAKGILRESHPKLLQKMVKKKSEKRLGNSA